MSLRQDTNFSGFVQFNRNEVPSGSSSGAKRSQPAPVDTSSSPRRARRLISARKRMTPKRAVMSGARTKRVVMRAADMRGKSQKSRSNPGRPTAADHAISGPIPRPVQASLSRTGPRPAKQTSAVPPAMADIMVIGISAAALAAKQLAVATQAAASTTAPNAPAAEIELGTSAWKMQRVPPTARRAAMSAPRRCCPVGPAMCGSRTTVNTGTREKRATRVSSEMP